MTLDDVEPGVTTQRYHNNGCLIMLEVNCIKFSLGIQNSLGMIMCKFHARQSKTEGIAASVRIFLEHPSYYSIFHLLLGVILYVTVNNFSVISGHFPKLNQY